jgi:hypothetical protein
VDLEFLLAVASGRSIIAALQHGIFLPLGVPLALVPHVGQDWFEPVLADGDHPVA